MEGQTYYFAATAYDIDGNESEFSEELIYATVVNSKPEEPNQPAGPSGGYTAEQYSFNASASSTRGGR